MHGGSSAMVVETCVDDDEEAFLETLRRAFVQFLTFLVVKGRPFVTMMMAEGDDVSRS